MRNLKQNNSSFILLFFDLLVISILFVLLLYVKRTDWFVGMNPFSIALFLIKYQFKSYLLILFSWFLISEYTSFYKKFRFIRFIIFLRRCIFQIFLFGFILFAISGIKNDYLFTNKESLLFITITTIYILISRCLTFLFEKYLYRKGYNLKNIIVIGNNENTSEIIDLFSKRNKFGILLKDIFVTENPDKKQKLLNLNDLEEYLTQNNIDYAYICLNDKMNDELVNNVIEKLEKHYISLGFIPSTALESKQTLEVSYINSLPVLTYKKYPLDYSVNQIIKRIFDITFALFVFIFILSWAYPIIALLVYIYQGRPILFSQKRNGLNGKEFDCLKFRTMRPDKHNNLKPTERNDPRVTKIGRILRKTSLDELPQFINVLKGDMSIVGPRPHMVSENQTYAEIIKRYALRHYVKPGITGLAQTRGYRGAINTEKDMEMRIRADIFYVRNWSFLLDIAIIFQTVKLMIVGDENAI